MRLAPNSDLRMHLRVVLRREFNARKYLGISMVEQTGNLEYYRRSIRISALVRIRGTSWSQKQNNVHQLCSGIFQCLNYNVSEKTYKCFDPKLNVLFYVAVILGRVPPTTPSGSEEPLRTMTHHNGSNVLLLFLLLTCAIDGQHNNDLCTEKTVVTANSKCSGLNACGPTELRALELYCKPIIF
jgi:hypothetical protein